MLRGLLVLGLLCWSVPGYAAMTYYLAPAPGGSDGNPCTQSLPCQTFTRGIGVMAPGDTLYLRAGTYNHGIPQALAATIPSGTSWANATKIAGFPGERPILDFCSGDNSMIVFGWNAPTRQHYIILDNLTFDGQCDGARTAIQFFQPIDEAGCPTCGKSPTHVRMHNLEIKNFFGIGSQGPDRPGAMGLFGSCDFCEYVNINSHHNGGNALDHGLYFCAPNVTIRDSEFHHNSGLGFQAYSGPNCAHGLRVFNNRLHHNGDAGANIGSTDDAMFYNNLVYENSGNGLIVGYGSPNTGIKLYNNTFYNNGPGGSPGIEVCGSTLCATPPINVEITNNLIIGVGVPIQVDAGGSATATFTTTSNPAFTDAANGNFTILGTSAARNAGTPLTAFSTWTLLVIREDKGQAVPGIPAHMNIMKAG